MGNWLTTNEVLECSENANKRTNYYFGKSTITVIPTKFYENRNYAGYVWSSPTDDLLTASPTDDLLTDEELLIL